MKQIGYTLIFISIAGLSACAAGYLYGDSPEIFETQPMIGIRDEQNKWVGSD